MAGFNAHAAVLVVFGAAVGLQAQNLLADSSFENGGALWLHSAATGRAVVTTTAHSGTHSEQMVLASASVRRAWQDVSVTAGNAYTVSGWVSADTVTSSAGIVVFWFDTLTPPINFTAADYLRADTLAGSITGTQAWTEQTGSLVAPAGALIARVYLLCTFGTGTAWFDDLAFAAVATAVRREAARHIVGQSPATAVTLYSLTGARIASLPNGHAADGVRVGVAAGGQAAELIPTRALR